MSIAKTPIIPYAKGPAWSIKHPGALNQILHMASMRSIQTSIIQIISVGFIDSFKRWRLARRGLSSGRKRRVQNDAAVSASIDRSIWVRFSLYLSFCVATSILVMRAMASLDNSSAIDGALYAFFLTLSGVTVIELNHPKVIQRNKRVVLLIGGILAQLGLIRGMAWIAEVNHLPSEIAFLMMPFIFAPMIHAVLLGGPVGVFSAVYASLLSTLLIEDGKQTLFLSVSLVSGLVVALILKSTRRRIQLIRAGIYAGIMTFILAVIFGVVDVVSLASDREFGLILLSVATALGMGLALAFIISGVLPMLEGLFQLTTDISWLELSDLNHKLMRRMQLEAPGTFHHSLVVASLSEAAAESVGASASMCRVCAYFHDIGKINKPEYFIENQLGDIDNPHDSLTPTMSALIIIAHVKDGVDLALKHHLNPLVIDVIREHHGNSLVSYFYHRAQQRKQQELDKVEQKLEDPKDLPKIDEKNFRYPGPRPQSRESGIISLADAVESSSRTLKKPTPGRIRSLVNEMVDNRIIDGQLDECQLTIQDISKIKDAFCKTLRSMLHSRIDYPKDDSHKSDSPSGREQRDTEKDQRKTESKTSASSSERAAVAATTPTKPKPQATPNKNP